MSEQFHTEADPSMEPAQTITVDEDELTVWKQITPYRDDVAKISFTIDSVAETPVAIQLTDQLPEKVEMDRVGFHPDYDPDGWAVGDGQTVIYETVVDPGESRETVYGARMASADDLESFAIEPSLEADPLDEEAPVPSNGSGESDDGQGLADDHLDAEPTDPATDGDRVAAESDDSSELDNPTATSDRGAAVDSATNGDGSCSNDPSEAVDAEDGPADVNAADAEDLGSSEPPGGIVDQFLGELKRRELTADERAVLSEELALEPTPSDAVRLDHVQATVDDLVAYRDALEGFIDEQGPAEAIVEEFRSSIADHSEAITRLEAAVDDLRDQLEALEETQADDVEALQDRVSSVETELSADLMALDEDVETMHAELKGFKEWREKLSVAAQVDSGVESDSLAD